MEQEFSAGDARPFEPDRAFVVEADAAGNWRLLHIDVAAVPEAACREMMMVVGGPLEAMRRNLLQAVGAIMTGHLKYTPPE